MPNDPAYPALVAIDRSVPATAAQMRAHVNRIQEVMQAVMKKDVHYGVVPGTKKPSLYKPGAEVLCVAFHIAPKFVVEDLSGPDFIRYRVRCIGVHQATGVELAEGMGECSSMEEKYRWRKAVSGAEYDARAEDRRRLKFYSDNTVKQVQAEHHDVANTILKMSCKRAHVAMAINATAASDIFTQDIEDMPEHLREAGESAADPQRLARLVAAADAAADRPALDKVWKDGVAECREASDKVAYAALKEKVTARMAALRATAPQASATEGSSAAAAESAQP